MSVGECYAVLENIDVVFSLVNWVQFRFFKREVVKDIVCFIVDKIVHTLLRNIGVIFNIAHLATSILILEEQSNNCKLAAKLKDLRRSRS